MNIQPKFGSKTFLKRWDVEIHENIRYSRALIYTAPLNTDFADTRFLISSKKFDVHGFCKIKWMQELTDTLFFENPIQYTVFEIQRLFLSPKSALCKAPLYFLFSHSNNFRDMFFIQLGITSISNLYTLL